MSSPPKENELNDLKAGHAPATKVAGMRVVQHKKEGEKEPAPMTAEEKEEFGVGSPPKEKPQGQLVSGVVTKGDKDFTPSAVKSFHEKPLPAHDNRPRNSQVKPQIHQPR